MSLRINELSFYNFRSYEKFQLHDIGMLSIFVGPNAIGKTNIVEGIQLLTALTSFRHANTEQLIRHGASAAQLSMCVRDDSRMLDIALCLENRKKRYTLNGKPKKASELRGLIPSITFTPDDLDLVKGSASIRRHALDALGCQLNENYHRVLKDYEKVLRHKNKMLKEQPSPLLLESVNEMVVTCGAQLCCYRAALFDKLAPYVKRLYEQIAGKKEPFEMWYVPSWEIAHFDESQPEHISFDRDTARQALEQALKQQQEEEITRHRALVGPHCDEIFFMVDGFSAADYASQGQNRSIVLAYKLAEANVVEEMLNQKPVLLLDDVMSELDASRRSALMDYVSDGVQTFITTANVSYFDAEMLSSAHVIELPLELFLS